jgi:hypothetical protein
MLPLNHGGKPVPALGPAWLAIRTPGASKRRRFRPPSRKRFPSAQASDADIMVDGTHVNALRLRSLAATLLSSWLGFLACVLGCAQPVSASAPSTVTQVFEGKTAAKQEADGKMAEAGPCGHHGHGASGKNKQGSPSVSCCPLDATLIQKQTPVSPLRGYPFVVALMLLLGSPSFQLSAGKKTNAPTVWHRGRDVLLQVHVLRI